METSHCTVSKQGLTRNLCAMCRPALQKAFQKQIDDMYKKAKSR
jgi:hypothetical protein